MSKCPSPNPVATVRAFHASSVPTKYVLHYCSHEEGRFFRRAKASLETVQRAIKGAFAPAPNASGSSAAASEGQRERQGGRPAADEKTGEKSKTSKAKKPSRYQGCAIIPYEIGTVE